MYSSSFVLVETEWVGAGQAHGMTTGGGGDGLLQREGMWDFRRDAYRNYVL